MIAGASRIVILFAMAVSPFVAAQRASLSQVVMVSSGSEEGTRPFRESFLDGMRQAGQVEGTTFRFGARYADGDAARLAQLTRESVTERPSVLVVAGLTGARLAHNATSSIPIVVATSSDLVDAGIVKSLAHPGGNVTGVSDLADETASKRLELIKAALPNVSRVALLVNPQFPATAKIEARVRSTAAPLGITITRVQATDRASLALAIDALAKSPPDALLVGGDTVLTAMADEIIERASALRIAVVHYWPGTAEQGAILSYQTDIVDNFRRAAGYVDRILKGAKPGELPIYQPTRYELVVNAKAARAFGLTLAPEFLVRADRVIQ
ncbi:MAG TPA: ABC transporter substrate-binding protein [Casimicrobiaceae bacterium]